MKIVERRKEGGRKIRFACCRGVMQNRRLSFHRFLSPLNSPRELQLVEMRLFATRHRVSSDDFPPRRTATRRDAISFVLRDFCSLFLHHLFPRTPRASPITCLFTDCIHLAAADARRMSQIKISSRAARVKVWRMTKGRASHADPSFLPFELLCLSGAPLS